MAAALILGALVLRTGGYLLTRVSGLSDRCPARSPQ
ncbi:protein of unknown function [Nocardia cyriacigeorgica GUH-2]|uniref:Uncharacterized protein n=1 Tax=Nocardia cyriacigeorgica (strain GUH-2) TaxID=1127134 RepID=H6R2Q5_NOCCG|nr:protein of unknown function [Nocardia cyriacigeorgica GUH-2]